MPNITQSSSSMLRLMSPCSHWRSSSARLLLLLGMVVIFSQYIFFMDKYAGDFKLFFFSQARRYVFLCLLKA
jgi:hypothetical protein